MSSSAVKNQEPRAQKLTFSKDALSVCLVDGRTLIVPLVWYPRLWHGSPEERRNYEIISEGAYIHWPDLDEDLTVAGLLEGCRSAESTTSLRKWLASRKETSSKKPQRRAKPVRRAG